jgi:hypothetical protein
MDKPERRHRPDPKRAEPVRDFMTYVRTSGLGAQDKPEADATAPAAESADEAVAHGVTLGYAVIDEQIKQGEKLAERLRQVTGKPGTLPGVDVNTLIERALNVYKDMGSLAMAAVETLIRNPVLQSAVARTWSGGGSGGTEAAPAPGAASGGATRFGFELTSNRRTQVKLEIQPRAVTFMPVVHQLHASNPSLPPLTGVRFRFDPATSTPVLHVDVADSQPAGTYMGVIVDSVSDEPCGTLSVRVLPSPA